MRSGAHRQLRVKMPKHRDLELPVLPPNTIQYPYKGLRDFWSLVSREQTRFHNDKTGQSSQYMVFTGVDNKAFTRDFDIWKHKSSWQLLDSYFPYTRILLIRMVTSKDHERAHTGLANLMVAKLASMNGVNLSLDWTGSADIHTSSRTKRADQEFAPRKLPPGRSDMWPTLVIESGFSESKPKLQSDAEWWLKASNGDVTTALTISVHRKQAEIVIEKWQPICTGQTSTRTQISPTLQQRVIVSWLDETPERVISNGPLVVSFQNLFLRPPAHTEGDIVFTDDDLGEVAKMVWEKQKFI